LNNEKRIDKPALFLFSLIAFALILIFASYPISKEIYEPLGSHWRIAGSVLLPIGIVNLIYSYKLQNERMQLARR